MRISNIASRLRNRSVVSATILALVGAQAGLAQAATASGPSYGPNSRDLVTHTPIKHVIIIIGENWSFDSLFATYVPKSSDKVWNLLSENIVKPDGSPGMNYSKAPQSSASDTSKYELAPPSTPYLTLPPALAGGPFAPYGCQLLGINPNDCNTPANVAEVTPFENGLALGYYQHLLTGGNPYGHEPDPRIWYDGVGASSLPPGVYQLTNTTHSPSLPYDSYWSSPAAAPAAALTLINPPSQSDVTVTFTATHTESIVFDEGYQVNDLETLTNNMVTLSGGGPNLLGSTWQYRFAAPPASSNSYTFNDGTLVPALGFGGAAQTNPLNMDTFYQIFATVPGKSYTYSFDYSNNTAGLPGTTNSLLIVTPGTVPEPSTWAMLLLGFVGLGLAGYRARRAAGAIA